MDTKDIACCFDKESQQMLEDFRKDGLGETSEKILAVLRQRGIQGFSSLELGCGVGALTLRLVKEGVTSAKGLDLSPQMVATARSLASEEGLADSASFEVGDGAKASLSPSDLVILDTVICCYPEPEALIDNTSAAAVHYYVLALPDDRRMATRVLRAFLPLQRAFIRRGTFRFYVHRKTRLVARLERQGFSKISDTSVGWIWSVVVFGAPSRT